MKKLLAVFALALGVSSMAQAGMLVEPYLGYGMGTTKGTYKAAFPGIGGLEQEDKTTGMEYGLRVGYKFTLLWAALDYTGGSGKDKQELAGTSNDYDYSTTALGVTFGAKLPMLRPYVGYGFSNEATIKATGGDSKMKGNYYKIGVGFGFIPMAEVNLEYKINAYNKLESGGTESNVSDVFDSPSSSQFGLIVSVPFNL